MDFFEFCRANKISDKIFTHLENCFENKVPVDAVIHNKMLELFHLYLIVGGMPAAVETYLKKNRTSILAPSTKMP